MKKIFKSRVARWYVWFCIIMTLAFIGSIYLCYKSTWVLLIDITFMGVCLIMLYDMLLHTDYTVDGEKLHIRCGILYRMVLPISDITEISKKSTILSSPALSAKRIGIKYGKNKWVYVSPKSRKEFVFLLRAINPEIQFS